jgi:predicted ferric reductase
MLASRPGLSRRDAGPATIAALVVAVAALWLIGRPSGEPPVAYLGQLIGAESILLLSIGLVLISTLPWVEQWFDGIDRAAIWHRRVIITGIFLLLPHVLTAASPHGTALGGPLGAIGAIGMVSLAVWAILPRWQSVVPRALRGVILAARDAPGIREIRSLFGGYERWRAWHRTTGLFVAAGFLHGVLDGTPWTDAPLLRWVYIVSGGIGIAFYVYRELLARYFMALHDYQVEAVSELADGLTEIVLSPIGRHMEFVPGQFAMLYLEGKDGWHRHPFSITSAPQEGRIRVTVKALGDYTSQLGNLVEPGMPAVVGGPHGRFNHERGTGRQVWIAAGVGVAPFLSWVRAIEGELPHQVDFFYSSDGEGPFNHEIAEIAAGQDAFSFHPVDTSVDGRLTPDRVLELLGTDRRIVSVFMCGPAPMLRDFQIKLRASGIPGRHIHREYFDWR